MKTFYFKKCSNLMLKKKKQNTSLLNILKLKRKKKNFYLDEIKIIKKNMCIETNSTHSVYSDFFLSRVNLRKNFKLGKINGLRKVSW